MRFPKVHSLVASKQELLHDLHKVAEECGEANWDGYGAKPMSPESYRFACRFVELLPHGTPLPSAGADPDGWMTLDWHKDGGNTLSISVSTSGALCYAALFDGSNKAYGVEQLVDRIPPIFLLMIYRLKLED